MMMSGVTWTGLQCGCLRLERGTLEMEVYTAVVIIYRPSSYGQGSALGQNFTMPYALTADNIVAITSKEWMDGWMDG